MDDTVDSCAEYAADDGDRYEATDDDGRDLDNRQTT